jgi:hypothetical protein
VGLTGVVEEEEAMKGLKNKSREKLREGRRKS